MVEAAITFGAGKVQYKLGEKIGEGGQGAVYLCTRLEDNEQVIAKLIKTEAGLSDEAKKEAESLTKFKHENIVKLLEAFEY